MSFMESLKFLSGSYYLALISVLVLAYGLIIALFEAVCKDQLSLYAFEIKLVDGEIAAKAMRTSFYAWMHKLNAISSVAVICMAPAIKKKGWRFAASVTPVIALVMIFCFFFPLCTLVKKEVFLTDLINTALRTPAQTTIYNGVYPNLPTKSARRLPSLPKYIKGKKSKYHH